MMLLVSGLVLDLVLSDVTEPSIRPLDASAATVAGGPDASDALAAPVSAGKAPAEPGLTVTGKGSAGVTEIGRPLDVLRPRAERLARERAMQAAVLALCDQGVDPVQARNLVSKAVESGDAGWQMSYWSNGSVTAALSIER